MGKNDAIVKDVLCALDAARENKDHPRLNKMFQRTELKRREQAAFNTSFYPVSLEQKQAFKEALFKDDVGYYEKRRGRYGAIIND